MWKTVLLLIFSLIIVPIIAFYYGTPLTELQKDVLEVLVKTYLFAALLCYVVSSITKNYSQVDKLWSIMPIIYVWIAAYMVNFEQRIFLMALVVTIWGLRLTWNFGRRGGYSLKFWTGEEDYRWAILRAKPEFQGAFRWNMFNLFFISLYQMGLVLLITLPIVKAIGGEALGILDYIIAAVVVAFVIMEYISDNQQYAFQTKKYRLINNGEKLTPPYSKGFIDSGFWSKMRHPNYSAEQAVWIVFYLFTITATGQWVNWSIVGCVLLIVLFKGSSDFSEEISLSKYPEYAEYQKTVGRFIPKLF